MKASILGYENLTAEALECVLPKETTELVFAGEQEINFRIKELAEVRRIRLTRFLPAYPGYKRVQRLRQYAEIFQYCDLILVFEEGLKSGMRWFIKTGNRYSPKVKLI